MGAKAGFYPRHGIDEVGLILRPHRFAGVNGARLYVLQVALLLKFYDGRLHLPYRLVQVTAQAYVGSD